VAARTSLEDLEVLDPEDFLCTGLGPGWSDGVISSDGALLDREWFTPLDEGGCLAFFFGLECVGFSGGLLEGGSARLDCESLLDSWSKVCMASNRDAFDIFISVTA
jgi:hypothetical protein